MIKIYENRQVGLDNINGTQNENNVTELTIEVPEIYQDWNKRIVFITTEGKLWDYIQSNNKYTIKNNITKYDEVSCYIWLTRTNEATESIDDFRSETFQLSFYTNEQADNQAPTEEQIDGFNSLITELNLRIRAVEALNSDFTKLIQDVEESEEQRNADVQNAINTIRDLKDEYNINAENKTNDFNANTSAKVEAYNQNSAEKLAEYNQNSSEKIASYNENATQKENELNTIAEGVRDMADAIQFANFEIDEDMNLCINTAEKFKNTSFSINEETGEMEVEIVNG